MHTKYSRRRTIALAAALATLVVLLPAEAHAAATDGATVAFHATSGTFAASDDGTVTLAFDTQTRDGLGERTATFDAGPDDRPVPLAPGIAADLIASEPTVPAVVQLRDAPKDHDALALSVTSLSEDNGVLVVTGTVEDTVPTQVGDVKTAELDKDLPAAFDGASATFVDSDVTVDSSGRPQLEQGSAFSLKVLIAVRFPDQPTGTYREQSVRTTSSSCVDNKSFHGDVPDRFVAPVFTLSAAAGEHCTAWLTQYFIIISGPRTIKFRFNMTVPVPGGVGNGGLGLQFNCTPPDGTICRAAPSPGHVTVLITNSG